jgi:membrane-bound lytic murein transglycosylase D
MRSKLYCIILILLVPAIRTTAGEPDSVRVDLGELSLSDSLEINMLTGEFESNLDSLVNLWYVENSLAQEPDSIEAAAPDTLFPDFPDSVYIERLSRLPLKVHLTYNRQVKNFIKVYTGKRRELVEVLLGLSDYYFPVFDEIFDAYGIPLELKYCSIIESALNPRKDVRADHKQPGG